MASPVLTPPLLLPGICLVGSVVAGPPIPSYRLTVCRISSVRSKIPSTPPIACLVSFFSASNVATYFWAVLKYKSQNADSASA